MREQEIIVWIRVRNECGAEKNAIDAEYDRLLIAHTALREETRTLSAKKDSGDKLRKPC